MPLYEYRCPKCKLEFERIVFTTDKESVPCPQCHAPNAERLLSVFSAGRTSGQAGSSPGSSCGPSPRGFS